MERYHAKYSENKVDGLRVVVGPDTDFSLCFVKWELPRDQRTVIYIYKQGKKDSYTGEHALVDID